MASRDDLEPMRQFVAEFGVEGFPHAVDQGVEVWAHFGGFSQPSFAFIDASGMVEVHLGAMGLDGLSATIERVLAP